MRDWRHLPQYFRTAAASRARRGRGIDARVSDLDRSSCSRAGDV
jgi:hypothetical protein